MAAHKKTKTKRAADIKDRALLILSARETETFANAILHPAEPGPVLRAAARHYKTTARR
jgi:uncharacterized protein (DUF1778 family)